MNMFWRCLIAWAIGSALATGFHRHRSLAMHMTGTTDVTTHDEAGQEQLFEYAVLADVLKRSVDSVRFVDTLLGVLLTALTAIYAILLDKAELRHANVLSIFDWAIATASIGIAPTLLFVREAPKAASFHKGFALSPRLTRDQLIQQFVRLAIVNERWRVVKIMVFTAALGLALLGSLAAAHLPIVH